MGGGGLGPTDQQLSGQGRKHQEHGHPVLTFSPVSVTTSNGPYMKRPFSTWGRPSHTTVSLARWLEVTFWWERDGKLGLDRDADVGEEWTQDHSEGGAWRRWDCCRRQCRNV